VSLHPALAFPDVVRPKAEYSLVLRGGGFDEEEPFRFKVLEERDSTPDALEYWLPYWDVGFRVVIEPPAGP